MLSSMCRRACLECSKKCSPWKQEVRYFKQTKDKVSSLKSSSSKVVKKPAPKQKHVEQQTDKQSLEHLQIEPEFTGRVPFSKLVKPFGFACVFTACSFGGAAIWQYEGMRSQALQRFADTFGGYFQTPKRGEFRELLSQWYSKLGGTERTTLGIIALNVAVFGCWRVRALQPVMLRWFTASPAARATCIPMVLSTFSHYAIWHLAVNMYVLWSFTRGIGRSLGKEQFLAFYLSGGVWSSFLSYFVKVASGRYIVSVGASGAIMAVLGAFCFQHPDAKLAIVFLPFFTFSAGMGLKALVAIETTGVVLGWQFFDHAAHLGGLLFGMFYMAYGHKQLWDKREPLMKSWHKWRGKPSDV
ncbi:presenilin-associated rhomboid-like protein, mitochondrial [Amphiura filiformis]|uniref:presenilin-associated rhomboid-like protein, mitochondrial n=1 Tax=Amphiura filiformis TaxID=82378 RepID=UPI003B225038